MIKNAVFTICAKNYLAQAITLRESTLRHNSEIDFFIFLADSKELLSEMNGLIELDCSWIPLWESMAFKYDIIEFSTSIKPYCINKLFMQYDKVIYLDPDIYVVDTLSFIFNELDKSSIMLTPHYCDIVENFDGAVSENVFLADGIYNLGFIAVRNNIISKKIINWWMNRLENQCYSDKWDALFVDQKWMDFIPAFYPEDTYISSHMGMNVAIWNLHERALTIKNGKYVIRRKSNDYDYPLVFFHFSGFDPYDDTVINRRHPQYNIFTYPSFKPIIEEYRQQIYENGYNKYSPMLYSFATFTNGEEIIPLYRRLYRVHLEKVGQEKLPPFSPNSEFYRLLSKKGLLTHKKRVIINYITSDDKNKMKGLEKRILHPILKLLRKIIGIRYYSMLIGCAGFLGRKEYHYFLIDKTKK
jgi:hypothetical protein